VNRVARQYLLQVNAISATIMPASVGTATPLHNFRMPEKVVSAPVAPTEIPSWAAKKLESPKVPQIADQMADMTLSNGVRLLVRTDTTTPTVTLLGSVRHNSGLQTLPGKEGVDDLLSLLYDYGTEKMGPLAFERALGEISAEESAGYHFLLRVPKEDLSRGLQLLAQNELTPSLTPQTFLRAQKEAIQQAKAELNSSDFKFNHALDAAMVPAGDPTLRVATPKTLSRITLNDVRQHYHDTVRPDLTTIVIVGDVSPEQARTEVERWFGAWRSVGSVPRIVLPPVPSNKAVLIRVSDPAMTNDSVVLAQQLPLDRFSPDYYPLQLGTQVLDGGFYASRLYRDLRRRTGYVYSVDASLDASATRAIYTISYDCDPRNIFKVQSIIEQDIEKMGKEVVTAEELHQAKSILIRQLALQASSQVEVATTLLEDAESGLTIDEPTKAANRYLALDAETVRKAFARVIAPDRFVQIVLGSLPTVDVSVHMSTGRRTKQSDRRFRRPVTANVSGGMNR
jgi:zinc protease